MGTQDRVRLRGRVSYVLRGADGRVKCMGATHNIVTDKGDALLSSLPYTAAPTFNIRLGKTATAPSKTYNNAGGYIPDSDSVAGAQRAMDATYPKVGTSPNIAQFRTTYPAAVATDTWNRAALVNATESNPSDGTLTYAIALLDPLPVAKGAGDTLEMTWDIEFTGS